jgi:hypothetical protein
VQALLYTSIMIVYYSILVQFGPVGHDVTFCVLCLCFVVYKNVGRCKWSFNFVFPLPPLQIDKSAAVPSVARHPRFYSLRNNRFQGLAGSASLSLFELI